MKVTEIILNQVVEQLEKGQIPWISPYRKNHLPQNYNGHLYQGMNVLFLSLTNYKVQKYLTFNQIKNLNGSILKGEKAHKVYAWFFQKNNSSGEVKDDESNFHLSLRYYNVWNIEQTDLFNDEFKNKHLLEVVDNEIIENFINNDFNICKINHSNVGFASYNKLDHSITMPVKENFTSMDDYYSSLFHEMIHSTMNELRPDTKDIYAFEELVAEIGANLLCQNFGVLNSVENSASYCTHWIKFLKENKVTTITKASNLAMKAVERLLNLK